MIDSRMQAFCDDFDIITVYISKNFYNGESKEFYLRDLQGMRVPLVIDGVENKENSQKYTCKLIGRRIEIGKIYDVVEQHGLAVGLQYRYVVQTNEFNEMFYNNRDDFGATVNGGVTMFVLWAPTASSVSLVLNPYDEKRTFTMKRAEKGAWQVRVAENLHGQNYYYVLNVNGDIVESLDPYGYGSIANAKASSVIDFKQIDVDFHDDKLKPFSSYTEAVIFEANVRDFSSDPNTNISHKGQYLGMIEKRTKTFQGNIAGFDYFKELGATHIQLMPVNDFLSVDELYQEKFYNWGYDPIQYNSLEGSYSNAPNNPLSRVTEFSNLVSEFHREGIRVNLDVVYNHMADIASSPFELTVPYLFFRRTSSGIPSNGSFCGNDVDTEKPMVRKYIIDSLIHYVKHYHIDGFRFDLMGIIDIETMQILEKRLRSIKPDIMIYGEGWDLPTFLPYEKKTTIKNSDKIPGVGFFNDYYRDNVKGGTSVDKKYSRGYALGDSSYRDAFKAALVANTQDLFGSKMFNSPEQSISYVESHDNMTLWDKIQESCKGESLDLMIKRHKFVNASLALSQGVCFYHMGQEFCRTKQGIDNSYMSPDEVNKIEYDRASEYEEVVKYTKDMIKLRKKLPVFRFGSSDLISKHMYFEDLDSGLLLLRFINISTFTEYDEIRVYFNPFSLNKTFDLEYYYDVLATEHGLSEDRTNSFILNPVSIVVLGKPKIKLIE